MSVTIDKLVTRCHASRRHEAVARTAATVARRRLAIELSEFVGPALSREPPIVRIRRLHVKLKLAAEDLGEETLVAAWARALAQSLFEALADPSRSSENPVVSARSLADFQAAFLRDLLTGRATGRWEYAEFDDILRLPTAQAAVTLLLGNATQIVATLAELERTSELERLASCLDEVSLERLFTAIAQVAGMEQRLTLTPADLLWSARQALRASPMEGLALDSRGLALRIFIQSGGDDGRSPRLIFHALLALTCVLEFPGLLVPGVTGEFQSLQEVQRRSGRQLPSAVSAMLSKLHWKPDTDQSGNATPQSAVIAKLLNSLDDLRPRVQSAAPPVVALAQPAWLDIECAGVLLLAGTVQRLGWSDLYGDPLLAPWGGPSFFQILLAGIGTAVLGQVSAATDAIDPAVSLLAGMDVDPDVAGLRRAHGSADEAFCRVLLQRLVPGYAAAAVNWTAMVDELAAELIRQFALRVPGFREAPRAAIARQFLHTSGRVHVSEKAICVELAPSPYHVALHICGMDDALPSVNWMRSRRLDFRLLGL